MQLFGRRGTGESSRKPATMKIIQEQINGIVCVTVKGRMEAGLAPSFEKTIKEIIASDRRRLLFDLSALDYLRSAVLRVILNTVKELNQKSGRVVLCCLSGYVKEIFEVNSFKDACVQIEGRLISPGIKNQSWQRLGHILLI
jgi:anti-anti-sigma factor